MMTKYCLVLIMPIRDIIKYFKRKLEVQGSIPGSDCNFSLEILIYLYTSLSLNVSTISEASSLTER